MPLHFSNLISNACTPFERRTNDIIHLFFSYEKICQKATKATIRKKELDRKAGQNKSSGQIELFLLGGVHCSLGGIALKNAFPHAYKVQKM